METNSSLLERYTDLEKKGYSYFNLQRAQVDELLQDLEGLELANIARTEKIAFGPNVANAKSSALSTDFNDPLPCILTMLAVIRLAANKHIMRLVRKYLGALPRLSAAGLSVYQAGKSGGLPSSDWHLDKGPLSWLTLFVYLSDVTPKTGAHAFVAGSHDDEQVRLALGNRFSDRPEMAERLSKTQRWSSREVAEVFPGHEVCNVGQAGLIIVVQAAAHPLETHPLL